MNALVIDHSLELTELRLEDAATIVDHLDNLKIYRNTLMIPSPYTLADAETFLKANQADVEETGEHTRLAIRCESKLVGIVVCMKNPKPYDHRAEVGYWVAESHWSRGIMTRSLIKFTQYCFDQFQFKKLTAHVFAGNAASEKVLTRCGFEKEGFLKTHYLKDGKPIDAIAYGRLNPA